jgi:Flp pilus assembly protein TadG
MSDGWRNNEMIIQKFNHYLKDYRGVTIAAFALVVPMLMAATGMAIDMSRAYMVKKRLGQAVDSAALAVAGSSGSTAELEDKMDAYIGVNFDGNRFATLIRTELFPTDDTLKIEAEARSINYFMTIFGHDHIDVYVEATVQKELRGIETVLVMDNTGSMGSNNNIATLRQAATDFVNIMFDRAPDPSVIKIGLVPYSTSVNVGRYGLGQYPDGSQYGDGTPFVNNPHGLSYTTNYNSSNGWLGCVTEGEPEDTTDHEGPWEMYRFCRDDDDNYDYSCYYRYRYPNYVCPTSYVTPLSSDQNDLLNRISTMNARGHTLGNYGMVWGWRLISPAFPFQEGSAWNDQDWRKSIIMMTDGQNTMHPYYSAYGMTKDHSIGTTQENEKFEEVCERMKEDGIIIYTITFTSSINSTTKDYYRECASDETKYYDAPGQSDLVDAFQSISRELSNLYISK